MARQKTDPLHVVVYPSNFNDDNGHKMLYVSPNAREEVGLDKLDDFCHEYENLPKGYVNRCFEALMYAIPHLIGDHKRVKTPIGSFYIKPQFLRTMTEDETVTANDIWLGGIDFRPTKEFREAVQRQFQSIQIDRRNHPIDTNYYSQRNPELERCLSSDANGNRYVTVEEYRRATGLSAHSARKCLENMTKGDNPILQKTKIGTTNVYTEV